MGSGYSNTGSCVVPSKQNTPKLVASAVLLFCVIFVGVILVGYYWSSMFWGWQVGAVIGLAILMVCLIMVLLPVDCAVGAGDPCPRSFVGTSLCNAQGYVNLPRVEVGEAPPFPIPV